MMKILLRTIAFAVFLVLIFVIVVYANPIGVADEQIRLGLWYHGVHSRSVDVDGYQIHYFEAGPANGTPLVLVHGLGSRGEDWSPLIPSFALSGFHVYVPDLLGYGRSPRPDVDYTITLQENLIAHFMQAVAVPRADVVGWSMGGWVAAKLAVDHPERVDRLVLYDSAGIYFPATFDATLFSPTDRAGLEHLTAMLQPHPRPIPEFIAQAAIERLQRNAWVIRRSVDAMTTGHDLLDFRLAAIRRPTLIVWGSKDVLIPPAVGQLMHRLIPDSSLTIIEGCGHLTPSDCSAATLATTLHFLKTDPPPKNIVQTLPPN